MRFLGLNITRAGRKANQRAYAAAKMGDLYADWIMAPTSANAEMRLGKIEVIRSRARDAERNEPIARRFLSMCEANIVGRGFSLRVNRKEDKAREIEAAFVAWLDQADAARRLSGPDVQRLAVRSIARDGEIFARLLRGSQFADGLGIQLVESDYCDHLKDDYLASPRVVMGVEVDQHGRETGYYMHDAHPGDTYCGTIRGQVRRVDASQIVHAFRPERPGQTRAVSWMTAVLPAMKMLNGYRESELVAARAGACKMGFYKIPAGDDFTGDGKTATDAPLSDATPGVFERMPSGWDFQQYDPTHPTTAYGQFVKDIQRDMAGGLGVAYNNLASDLENVNYSSIRQGSIEEREQWMVLQAWFAASFLRPIYRAWLPMAVTSGTVKLPISSVDEYLSADVWTGRRWMWVDPLGDIQAKEREVAMGLTAPSIIAAEQGANYAEIQKRIAADNAEREANGLPPVVSQPVKASG